MNTLVEAPSPPATSTTTPEPFQSGTAAESSEPTVRPAPRPTRLLLGLIHLYQAARHGRPSPCRYVPSCSEYAATALSRHGAARGSWMAARRLSRCHPWGGYGADPVPEPPGVRNPS